MDNDRRRSFGTLLTEPFSKLSEDTYRACLFAACACNVDTDEPVEVLTWFAETGSAIIWC